MVESACRQPAERRGLAGPTPTADAPACGRAADRSLSLLPGGSEVKNPPAKAGDIRNVGSTPGLGRSPGAGHGNPLQYSCLQNPMDGGAWWATVNGVIKSQIHLSMHAWCR